MRSCIALLVAILTLAAMGEEMTDVKTAMATADSLFSVNKYEESKPAYETLLSVAQQANDSSAQVEAMSQIARCYLLKNDKEQCATWLDKAKELATPDQPQGWTRYLGVRGRLEWKRDEIPTAIKTFTEMFDYAQARGINDRAIDAVHMVAIIGTPEQQLEWSMKGIKLAEETGTNRWLGPLWNNLAITYCDQDDWDKAVEAFRKARIYHWQYGSEIHKLYADYHIGYALRMKGDFDAALTWLRPVLAWAERLNNDDVIGQASQDMGEIMIARGDKEGGLKLLHRAQGCFEREGYADFAPDILEKLKARIAALEK